MWKALESAWIRQSSNNWEDWRLQQLTALDNAIIDPSGSVGYARSVPGVRLTPRLEAIGNIPTRRVSEGLSLTGVSLWDGLISFATA